MSIFTANYNDDQFVNAASSCKNFLQQKYKHFIQTLPFASPSGKDSANRFMMALHRAMHNIKVHVAECDYNDNSVRMSQ